MKDSPTRSDTMTSRKTVYTPPLFPTETPCVARPVKLEDDAEIAPYVPAMSIHGRNRAGSRKA